MKHQYVSSGIPFYRTKEIKQLANKRDISTELFIEKSNYLDIKKKFGAPKRGDILLTAIGTIGEVYVIDNDDEFYFKDGNVLWIKNLLDVDPEYLKFIVKNLLENLSNLCL
jgi:type I restriction enzyme S subunit